jgi:hypothetical protein
MSQKRGDIQQSPQINFWTGGHEVSHQIFDWTMETKRQDIVKESAPSQTEEETTNSLHAGAAGAPATFVSSACTNWKKKMAICL